MFGRSLSLDFKLQNSPLKYLGIYFGVCCPTLKQASGSSQIRLWSSQFDLTGGMDIDKLFYRRCFSNSPDAVPFSGVNSRVKISQKYDKLHEKLNSRRLRIVSRKRRLQFYSAAPTFSNPSEKKKLSFPTEILPNPRNVFGDKNQRPALEAPPRFFISEKAPGKLFKQQRSTVANGTSRDGDGMHASSSLINQRSSQRLDSAQATHNQQNKPQTYSASTVKPGCGSDEGVDAGIHEGTAGRSLAVSLDNTVEPAAGSMDDSPVFVKGTVKRVRFFNPENGFTIAVVRHTGGSACPSPPASARARASPAQPPASRWGGGFKEAALEAGIIIVKGSFGELVAGQSCHFTGVWKYSPKYGHEFDATSAVDIPPENSEDLVKYLGGGVVKGVGPKTARLIVDKFGLDTVSVLDSKDAAKSLCKISGIGKAKAAKIVSDWSARRVERQSLKFLTDSNVSMSAAQQIVNELGSDTEAEMTRDPWQAAEGLSLWSFPAVESLALAVGADPDLLSRRRSALSHVLSTQCFSSGHSYLPWLELCRQAQSALSLRSALQAPSVQSLEAAMLSLLERKAVVVEDDSHTQGISDEARCYCSPMHMSEVLVAADVRARLQRRVRLQASERERVAVWIDTVEVETDKRLSQEQRRAVEAAAFSSVFVLTGGPGCGKTHTTRTIVKLWTAMGKNVLLCAPTGRAAQNLAETTGREAKTIHRLLAYKPRGEAAGSGPKQGGGDVPQEFSHLSNFSFNASRQLDADALVVDEASMLDLPLCAALLAAVPASAQLLLVGDVDQLPPVGPGQVLQDIIRSEQVPVFRLEQVFRQAQQSAIVESAHRVNRGEFPQFETVAWMMGAVARKWWEDLQTDCIWLEAPDRVQRPGGVHPVLTLLEQAVTTAIPSLGFDPLQDVQVLSAIRRGPLGTAHINKLLQRVLNPASPSKRERASGQLTFREGDRVIQLVNDYDLGVFNGDLGRVKAVDSQTDTVHIALNPAGSDQGKEVVLGGKLLANLGIAWAITIHKSQGSEYPVVILPISSSFGWILSRKLLYTGLSRAKKLVVVIGSRGAITDAIRTVREDSRLSHLRHRLVPSS